MANKNFMLLSMDDSQIKDVANVVSNPSCKKILDQLVKKEATESELAEKLKIPISTVHYNLKQLRKANLVVTDKFHYSKKGREVAHYSLANKYIIITPKRVHGIKQKLKAILPIAVIAAGVAGVIQFFTKYFPRSMQLGAASNTFAAETQDLALKAAPEVAEAARMMVEDQTPVVVNQYIFTPNIALWFLFGALFVLAVYLIWNLIKNER